MFFRRLRAERPKAALVIVHGMGEHGGRYEDFAEYLNGRGFTCYLPDLRGFGKSGGKRGCIRRFEDYFRDLESVYRALVSSEGPLDAFFLGHSYGGLITAHFLAEHPELPIKGMVLTSPNFGIAIQVPAWRNALGVVGSAFFPDFTQPNRVDPGTLTHDAEHLRKHESDPLIHDRISARLYTELLGRIRSMESAAARIKIPSLVLQAGEDRVVSVRATERFFASLASPVKELEVYPGLYHEILNETSRRTVFARIADWLSQRA